MHLDKPSNDSRRLAVFSLVLAATLWGLIWYPLRYLEQQGINGLWSTFLLYAAALTAFSAWFARCVPAFARYPGLFSLLALSSAWSNIGFILAVLDSNVLRAMLLFYLSPIWATLGARLWLKERISTNAWVNLTIAMSGAIIMLWDPAIGSPMPRNLADIFALTAGISFAVSTLSMRKLETQSDTSKIMASWLGVSVLAIAIIAWSDFPVPNPGWRLISFTVLFGVIALFIMTYAVIYGISRLPVHRSSVIMLFELVVGAVTSLTLTNESMRLSEWVGGFCIVTAAYISASQKQIRYSEM